MAQHRYSDISEYTPSPGTRASQEEELFLEPESDVARHRPENIHLATLGEKKRLWWRNALINILYILSWCVIPF